MDMNLKEIIFFNWILIGTLNLDSTPPPPHTVTFKPLLGIVGG